MVIHLVGEHLWEDVNWNGQGHRSCANTELRTFCRLLYPGMFPWAIDERLCTHGSTGCSGSMPTWAPFRMPW
jgi:hypothetical protein